MLWNGRESFAICIFQFFQFFQGGPQEPPALAGPLALAKWFKDGCPDKAISASGNSSLGLRETRAEESPASCYNNLLNTANRKGDVIGFLLWMSSISAPPCPYGIYSMNDLREGVANHWLLRGTHEGNYGTILGSES